jgi:malonate transporter and related proteins
METFLNLTIPVFVVIAIGWIAARKGIVPDAAVSGLNAYVFNFGVPCLVIGTFARQPFGELVEPLFLASWLVAGLAVFGLSALLTRLLFREGPGEMALMGQGAAIGNIGFIGLPLMLEAFGPKGAGPLAAALVVDLVLIIPMSILILEARKGGAGSGVSKALAALKGAMINPFLLSILAGIAVSLSGITLPGPIDRTIGFLGAAAAPTALFALGMSLAGRQVEGNMAQVGLMSAMKLVAHPAALFAAMTVFKVPPAIAGMGLVLAALPVASNVFVIAERYGVAVRRCSSAIVVSTAIAVVTVTAAIEIARRMAG